MDLDVHIVYRQLMAKLPAAQTIECFHLAFLGVLRTRLAPTRYVLKGGANLRYFFDSARYSEDIDLDVAGVRGSTLEKNVDGVLTSKPLEFSLRSCGLRVAGVIKPQQTDTTRRWKLSIAASGHRDPVRTKIEFSHRDRDDRYVLETVPDRVVKPYGTRSPSVQHYTAAAATEQKIRAVAGRSKTQARDVFDLELLLRRTPLTAGALDPELCRKAAERGLELPHEAFIDQVLAFLDPEVAELYDATVWEQMQEFVVSRLLEGR